MTMKRKGWAWLAGAAALLILVFALKPATKTAPVMAPDFAYPDLGGTPVPLASFRGKLVFLDLFATWCDPCREEIPDLIQLHKTFKDKGFTVVGVATDANGASVVRPFAKELGIVYPVLVSDGEIPEGYPVTGFPTAFLIGRDGKILRRYLGGYPYEELARDVQDALAGR